MSIQTQNKFGYTRSAWVVSDSSYLSFEIRPPFFFERRRKCDRRRWNKEQLEEVNESTVSHGMVGCACAVAKSSSSSLGFKYYTMVSPIARCDLSHEDDRVLLSVSGSKHWSATATVHTSELRIIDFEIKDPRGMRRKITATVIWRQISTFGQSLLTPIRNVWS